MNRKEAITKPPLTSVRVQLTSFKLFSLQRETQTEDKVIPLNHHTGQKTAEHERPHREWKQEQKHYLCHVDEGNSAVVLPHASSSSQPEVKVHATAASEDLCTSQSSGSLFEVFRTTL